MCGELAVHHFCYANMCNEHSLPDPEGTARFCWQCFPAVDDAHEDVHNRILFGPPPAGDPPPPAGDPPPAAPDAPAGDGASASALAPIHRRLHEQPGEWALQLGIAAGGSDLSCVPNVLNPASLPRLPCARCRLGAPVVYLWRAS